MTKKVELITYKKLEEKSCIWVNFYRYNTITEGDSVVYYRADGTKWMDRRVLKVFSVSFQDNEIIIKLETETNVLTGVFDRGNGFIPYPGPVYDVESVM